MITIVLPYIPPSMNQTNTWHWAKKAKEKKQVEEDIFLLAYSAKKGHSVPWKYAKIRITYHYPDLRRRDIVDNYNPKWIMDGIVKAGIIEDDRHEFVGVPELIPAYDKGNAHTTIEIWEEEKNAKTYACEGKQTVKQKLQNGQKTKRKASNKGTTA